MYIRREWHHARCGIICHLHLHIICNPTKLNSVVRLRLSASIYTHKICLTHHFNWKYTLYFVCLGWKNHFNCKYILFLVCLGWKHYLNWKCSARLSYMITMALDSVHFFQEVPIQLQEYIVGKSIPLIIRQIITHRHCFFKYKRKTAEKDHFLTAEIWGH